MRTPLFAVSLFLALPASALRCGPGCYPFRLENHKKEVEVCACDAKPAFEKDFKAVVPSNEKPPKSGMPSWQADGIKVIEERNLDKQDAKEDQEKIDADAEGKRRAGLK